MYLGDSVTDPTSPPTYNTWPATLLGYAEAALGHPVRSENYAQGGKNTYEMDAMLTPAKLALITAQLGAAQDAVVLINIGGNDINGTLPAEAALKANYLSALDKLHAALPVAQIYICDPWIRGYDTQADTFAGWVTDIIAARPTFVHQGHDSRVWVKGSDNGATNTIDGAHYTVVAGQAAVISQWRSILGW